MAIDIRIEPADDEDAIRAKVYEALAPFDAQTRRRILQNVRYNLDVIECVHAGIGLPGCPTCGPRTRAKLSEMDDGHEWNCGRSTVELDPLCAKCLAESAVGSAVGEPKSGGDERIRTAE